MSGTASILFLIRYNSKKQQLVGKMSEGFLLYIEDNSYG